MGKLDRPEEPRQKDAAVIVVNLRARTGLKQVDSYEGKLPCLVVPSTATYLPSMASMWVSRLYVCPSLPLASPVWKASAVAPWKSVIVLGSTLRPWSRTPLNGSQCLPGPAQYVNKIVRGHQPEPA